MIGGVNYELTVYGLGTGSGHTGPLRGGILLREPSATHTPITNSAVYLQANTTLLYVVCHVCNVQIN